MGAYNLRNNAYPTFHEQAEKIGTDINWLWLIIIHSLWLFSNIKSKFEWMSGQKKKHNCSLIKM